jgi:hypothetical protein
VRDAAASGGGVPSGDAAPFHDAVPSGDAAPSHDAVPYGGREPMRCPRRPGADAVGADAAGAARGAARLPAAPMRPWYAGLGASLGRGPTSAGAAPLWLVAQFPAPL